MNVNKTKLPATKGFTIVHCRLWNMVDGSNFNWNRCIRILERVQSSKTLQSSSNPRFTISASYQQSPTDKWPGILRNNKSWNSELCRERMWESWRDRKTAHWIREETKVPDIMEIISTLKWNWACYLARTTDNRWTISITFRTRRGHIRNWGKPRTRWREDLDGFQNL